MLILYWVGFAIALILFSVWVGASGICYKMPSSYEVTFRGATEGEIFFRWDVAVTAALAVLFATLLWPVTLPMGVFFLVGKRYGA